MEVIGVVKNGRIDLPASVELPEGAEVRVIIDDPALSAPSSDRPLPLERKPLTREHVLHDIAWALSDPFPEVIVVADTGPLLHLYWVAASDWALPDRTILVVEPVWQEVAEHAPDALRDARLERTPAPEPIDSRVAAFPLDAAEIAALALALSQTNALVLCDELDARDACSALGLRFVGSVGLIVQAARVQRVTAATAVDALRQLPIAGRMHVARGLIEEAIATIRGF